MSFQNFYYKTVILFCIRNINLYWKSCPIYVLCVFIQDIKCNEQNENTLFVILKINKTTCNLFPIFNKIYKIDSFYVFL